ncbi:MAG TPA: HPr family phosphocarrier protein [Thiotrichales bacterium]|nr:HPr family phosphocarrier protein [Thiotrichales bacterium]
MIEREIEIVNRLGLHARAAAKFVTLASAFEAEITLEREGRTVNGKSIMGVMMLAASRGTRLTLRADGPDEAEAVEKLEELVRNRFDEAQ